MESEPAYPLVDSAVIPYGRRPLPLPPAVAPPPAAAAGIWSSLGAGVVLIAVAAGVAVVAHSSAPRSRPRPTTTPVGAAGRLQAPARRGGRDARGRRLGGSERRHHDRRVLGAAVRPLPSADADPGRAPAPGSRSTRPPWPSWRPHPWCRRRPRPSPCPPAPAACSAPPAGPWPRGPPSTSRVAAGSTLRLQQLLAQLGYLPVTFTPAGPLSAPQELAQPQEGTFAWRFAEPAALTGPVDRRARRT